MILDEEEKTILLLYKELDKALVRVESKRSVNAEHLISVFTTLLCTALQETNIPKSTYMRNMSYIYDLVSMAPSPDEERVLH